MPHLEDWHEKYRDKGFTIIGVHSPEFDFERDPENVRWAMEHYGIDYPVVLDNHFKIWHAYANAYWHRKYMVLNGKIVYDHVGEGNYHETEVELRGLLKQINPDIDLSAIPLAEDKTAKCQMPTPETYCGFSRGEINNPEGLKPMQETIYSDPGTYARDGLYLQGRWRSDRQYLEHVGTDPTDHLVLSFNAVSVNLVMVNTSPEPVTFSLDFNDGPMRAGNAGDDVENSTVTITRPRMYNLFRASEYSSGTLRLKELPDGLRLYAFSFGGCVGVT